MGKTNKELARLLFAAKVLAWLLIGFLIYYYILPASLVTLNFVLILFFPFLLGALLGALLEPLVEIANSKLKLPKSISAFVTLLVFVGGILASLTWVVARVITELIKLSNSFPLYAEKFIIGLEYALGQIRILYFALDIPQDLLNKVLEQLEGLSHTALNAINWVIGMLTAVPSGILTMIFAFISSYFFIKDKEKIVQVAYEIFPARVGNFLHKIGGETGSAIIGYIRAQLILMLITMAQTLLGLYFLKVDYVLLLTIFVGFLDFLPVLGPGIIFVPWAIISFLSGNVSFAIALVVLYSILSLVRQVLQPKIVGDYIGIHPLETLISLYVGFKLLGIIGIIIGPILLVVLKGCWQFLFSAGEDING